MQPYSLLLIEDEITQLKTLQTLLEGEGYHVDSATTGNDALNIFSSRTIDIVISDFNLPDMDGLSVLEKIKQVNPEIPVIIVTAYGSIDRAVTAMKSGAYNYLTKPININELLILLKRASEHRILISENTRLREALNERFTVKGVVANSPKMQEVLNTAGRAAPSKATVLIRGESGTGKEVIARVIHHTSPRKDAPFIAFNVGALAPTLIEDELFGHEKGAFTGADRQRDGRFIQANTGTLFIDEIGDIPIELQTKFLRVLQENGIERLGSHLTIPIDVRIIAATNKNLEAMIRIGSFREDLYYRLNVVSIHIPPLRERKEDILPLCDLFIKIYSAENNKQIQGFTREAFDLILKYNFPGNIRELENMVERAIVLTRGTHIGLTDLPPTIFLPAFDKEPSDEGNFDAHVEKLEKYMILAALRKSGGNQSLAARSLKISERKLRYKMKKYKLT